VPKEVKRSLLRELESAFEELMSAARSLGPLAPATDGAWSAFEVLAHLDGWHRSAAGRLGEIARGEEPSAPPPFDEANAAFVVERAALNGGELLRSLGEGFALLREAVAATPGVHFWRGRPGEEDSLAYFIAHENGPGHYREHMAGLRTHQSV
jgi:hypothetical protein